MARNRDMQIIFPLSAYTTIYAVQNHVCYIFYTSTIFTSKGYYAFISRVPKLYSYLSASCIVLGAIIYIFQPQLTELLALYATYFISFYFFYRLYSSQLIQLSKSSLILLFSATIVLFHHTSFCCLVLCNFNYDLVNSRNDSCVNISADGALIVRQYSSCKLGALQEVSARTLPFTMNFNNVFKILV